MPKAQPGRAAQARTRSKNWGLDVRSGHGVEPGMGEEIPSAFKG